MLQAQLGRHAPGRAALRLYRAAPRPLRSIALWSRIKSDAATLGAAILGPRYLRVRLDDLGAAPAEVLHASAQFADVPDYRLAQAVAQIEAPPTLGRWRQQDPALLAALHAEAGAALDAFGYGR